MVAFWGLVILVGYGCFHGGGLVTVLDGWLGANNTTFVDPFPLLGALKTSTIAALGVTLFAGFTLHRILSRPMQPEAEWTLQDGAIDWGLAGRPLLGQLAGAHRQKLLPLLLALQLPCGAIGQEQLMVLPSLVRPTG